MYITVQIRIVATDSDLKPIDNEVSFQYCKTFHNTV